MNTRNQMIGSKKTAPDGDYLRKSKSSLQRPGTAKMRPNNNMRKSYSRLQTAKPNSRPKRPSTAYMSTASTFNSTKSLKRRKVNKCDPVSRYQSMKNSWTNCKFLSQNKGTKEGRKLDLAGYNQWVKHTQNSQHKPVVKQVHRYINPLEAPTMNKRDELVYNLRAKLTNEDYVDGSMKYFHYTKPRVAQ